MAMKFRPCIDIHKGKVKQIVGSTLEQGVMTPCPKTNFVSQRGAEYFALKYKNDNLGGGHVIMLDDSDETVQEALSALKIYPDGLQVGGNITLDNAQYFLDKGASHVITTSQIFTDFELDLNKLSQCVSKVGKERVVLDLSCRKRKGKYFVVQNKWQKFTNLEVKLETLRNLSQYCSEFLIHGVDVEGKKQGVDVELLEILGKIGIQSTRLNQQVSLTYAGGVSSFEDIELIRKIGEEKIDVTIGSALDIFGGRMAYGEVIEKFG